MNYRGVLYIFIKLSRKLGWRDRDKNPRIHDFRHSFAVRRLLKWYKEGANLDQKILALSTYLGHAQVTDTYWYLSAVPELLAIPLKRFDQPSLEFLQREEMEAIIAAPDKSTFSGHRDFVMFMTLYNTGSRVSEIIRLRVSDVCLESKASVLIHGKGRKQRAVPLWSSTKRHLKRWLLQLKSDFHHLKNEKYLHIRFVIPRRCTSFNPASISQSLHSGLDMKAQPPHTRISRLI